VVNAIESIAESGSVIVRLSTRRNGSQHDEAVITVSDTGCGIAAENSQRIFEPFFTTKPEGTGLGLSAVKRTAATCNGRISFQSCIGCGSTFELFLPLSPNQHAR
jgi:signal transduction histidine kinase